MQSELEIPPKNRNKIDNLNKQHLIETKIGKNLHIEATLALNILQEKPKGKQKSYIHPELKTIS